MNFYFFHNKLSISVDSSILFNKFDLVEDMCACVNWFFFFDVASRLISSLNQVFMMRGRLIDRLLMHVDTVNIVMLEIFFLKRDHFPFAFTFYPIVVVVLIRCCVIRYWFFSVGAGGVWIRVVLRSLKPRYILSFEFESKFTIAAMLRFLARFRRWSEIGGMLLTPALFSLTTSLYFIIHFKHSHDDIFYHFLYFHPLFHFPSHSFHIFLVIRWLSINA